MTRIVEGQASKGSQAWLQKMVQYTPEALQPIGVPTLEWLSPVADDEWAEYRDETALAKLGFTGLAERLSEFWPARGPVWDGLAMAGETVLLVEAKSHIREFLTPPSAASAEQSVAKIDKAFRTVKKAIGADDRSDWSRTFYQYANRLAHLWWLREAGVDAKLLLVSFLNDEEVGGPHTSETWRAVYLAADHALGLPTKNELSRSVLHVYPDVSIWRDR